MTGGLGNDHFVFGGVDTGTDRITDYDFQQDVIDLSALFWDRSGDARQSISVRLDANFTTEIPTLDSVFVIQIPGGGSQEIILEDRVVGNTQLIQLTGEGRIRIGGLSIPSAVQVTLASVASSEPDEPFDIVVTRSGEGIAAVLRIVSDKPMVWLEVLEGNAVSGSGQSASVRVHRDGSMAQGADCCS